MNYIKKHKTPFIVLVLLFILVIFMSIYIFFYQTNSNKYGNRLNGIENVHMVVEARTLNGDYDVVVALTKVVKHKMTRLIDKFCDDTLFIPYNGTNVETLIIRIARELNECNS